MSFCLSQAQDIEQVAKAKPLTVNGGINLNSGWYHINDTSVKRDPFTWGINANLNFNVFGVIDVPFTLVYNKQDKSLGRPEYKNIGFSPKYKGYTLHVGYRNMQFSPYTYSGITFFGVGAEVAPEESPVKFSGFYGRLNEAIPYNYATGDLTNIKYRRRGWGSKVTIGKSKHIVDLIVFKAIDDIETIIHPADSVDVKPEENIVIGINTTNKITERLSFRLEYARSILSTDTRIDEKMGTQSSFINQIDLFKPRTSTASHNAISGGLNYQGNSYTIGVSYKRVEPEYRSLGTSYSTNDIEDWLINASKSFFSNRINLNGSLGKQRNDLARTKETKSIRTISSLNASFTITKALNASVNYSNFASNTSPSVISFTDSIKFIQTTSNIGANVNYNFGTDNYKHILSGSYNIQNANTLNQTGQEKVSNNTVVKSSFLTYGLTLVPLEMTINTSLNYTVFEQDSIQNKTIGPTIGTGRSFFKKRVQTNISFSFLNQENANNQTSKISVITFSAGYRFWENHSIMLSNAISLREQMSGDINKKVREIRGNIRYSYSF